MSKLLSILKEGSEDLKKLGGESRLEKQLTSHRQWLFVTFLVLFAVLILLIVMGAFGIWPLSMDCNPTKTNAIGLIGGSGGLVGVLCWVWKQWSRTSLVIVLLADAQVSLQAEILRELIKKLD